MPFTPLFVSSTAAWLKAAGPAWIQGRALTGATSGTTIVTAFSAAVGVGNTVCGFVTFAGSGPNIVSSVSDDKGNSYFFESGTLITGDGQNVTAFHRSNITNAPTTITVTLSVSNGFFDMVIDEFSGCFAGGSDGRDVASQGQYQSSPGGTTDAVQSGAGITTVTNGCLIYGATLGDRATLGTYPIIGTGFAVGTSGTGNAGALRSEWLVQAAAGSGTKATFTGDGSINWATWVIALKPAGAVAPGAKSLAFPTSPRLRFMRPPRRK